METRATRYLHPRAADTARARTYSSRMAEKAAVDRGPIDESLPALRRAELLPPIVIAVVVVLSFTQDPAPSLSGSTSFSKTRCFFMKAKASWVW